MRVLSLFLACAPAGGAMAGVTSGARADGPDAEAVTRRPPAGANLFGSSAQATAVSQPSRRQGFSRHCWDLPAWY